MPVQQTFSIIPELGPRSRSNNQPVRPMTSKQVKKAYKEANKKPRISKAEQRRLDLAEQERIRKEFEKEKQAARAKAARERKKEKELAQKEARRRNGKPLVDVRPSQDTISRFVRGNGTGKKRDGTGMEVAERSAPLAAVAEETETHTEHETDAEGIDLVKAEKPVSENNGDRDDGHVQKPSSSHIIPRNSQSSSQRPLHNQSSRASSQQRKHSQRLSQDRHSHPNTRGRDSRRASQVSLNQQIDDNTRPHFGDYSGQAVAASFDPVPSFHQQNSSEELPVESDEVQDRVAIVDPPAIPLSADDPFHDHASKPIPPSGKSSRGDPALSCQSQSRCSSQAQRPFKRCESFRFDSDYLVDDESLLQLDSILDGNSISIENASPHDNLLPLARLDVDHKREETQPTVQKDDSQSSLDFDMLENMNTVFDEMTACQLPAMLLQTTKDNDTESELDNQPRSCLEDQTHNGVGASDSFGYDDLDDGTLLCLDKLDTKSTNEKPRSGREPKKLKAPTTERNRKGEQSTSYARDLGLVPNKPPPRTYVPLSTQAILSDLNDFFPSPSQQARELDDLPASNPLNTPCPPPVRSEEPLTSEADARPLPQLQKRFFTSSGSNELFSLALQRSRRTAALENIQRKDRHRHEAGLQAQARKQAVAREQVVQGRTHQKSEPEKRKYVPAPAAPQSRPKAPTLTPPVTCRTPSTTTRVYLLNPAQSTNLSTTRRAIETTAKAPQLGWDIDMDNKENLAHKLRTDDRKPQDAPSASQETEYGGDWIDDAWADGLVAL